MEIIELSDESEKKHGFASLRNGVERAAAKIATNSRSTSAEREEYVDLVKAQSADKLQFILKRRVKSG